MAGCQIRCKIEENGKENNNPSTDNLGIRRDLLKAENYIFMEISTVLPNNCLDRLICLGRVLLIETSLN